MAGSRLERIGTIFSRVTGLLQSRAMALEDRPVWYDVYKTFPPSTPPRYDRPVPDEPVREIFYPEDVIRAKFHKRMGKRIASINLSDTNSETQTQNVIKRCSELQSEKQLNIDEALSSAIETLGHEESISSKLLRKKAERKTDVQGSIVDSFKQVTNKTPGTKASQIDFKSIFKDE